MADLTANEQAVLDVVRNVSYGDAADFRAYGHLDLTKRTINRLLEKLEVRALVVRVFNAHGPQTPWYWQPADWAPADFTPPLEAIVKQSIWDLGRSEDRTWLHVVGEPNEHGAVPVKVKAGEHNDVSCFMPVHYFNRYPYLVERQRGEVTEWSGRFYCPVHGQCTLEMVTTAKTCSICGSLLDRT